MKTILTSDLIIYIDSSGSDQTGDGSQNNPFATLQFSRNYAQQNFDLNYQYKITYQCNGNFTNNLVASSPLTGQLNESFELFNFTAGSTVIVQNTYALQALNAAMFSISQPQSNLTIEAQGVNGVGIGASQGGVINILNNGNGITLSNCGMNGLQTAWGGSIYWKGGFTTGSSQAFAFASGGVIQFDPGFITYIVGTPTYSYGFCWSYGGGMIGVAMHNFSGQCTGKSARAEFNGMISRGGVWMPGSGNQLITGGQIN